MSAARQASARNGGSAEAFDLVIIGAGFAGMYMLHKARERGLKACVLEAGGGVGGTWYWNRYPGARCDVESMQYSYQFSEALQQEWEWSERYAAQPEILRYANHVADRFDLRRDIRFNARVTSAVFDEATGTWAVATDDGRRATATFVVTAMGCLSSANTPKIAGLESFKGAVYHTGQWPHEGVDFSGMRVAVIGTGSSAIQSIPHFAEQARELHVFQRTANYMVPAHNRPLDPDVQRQVKADYPRLRALAKQSVSGLLQQINEQSALAVTPEEREREFEGRWQQGGFVFLGAYIDLLFDQKANDTAAEFVRGKIRETVRDPKVAALLSPSNVIGCKRLCVDTGYWQTFNRANVTLVDVSRTPIDAITPEGIRVGERDYAVDAIVFATGFDAMTGALLRVDIRGRDGLALKDKWMEGPRTYLGLGVAGFPNLFTITGPGSPSVLTNMIPSIEQHVEWIADCIGHMRAKGFKWIEAETAAEEAWVAHAREVAGLSLRSTCSSWYLGANIPGKPRVYLPYTGGFPAYVQKCSEVAARGYEGFALGA
ncbi:MAG TPA: NAD(P)/FAD-dependent oxidoreductase [Candidatus Sulfotelmatobacter sp.]|nr:NAD(P)/FAD-dependent oxidoreductase [Candidatus Sulfotelmatobacter sp.]